MVAVERGFSYLGRDTLKNAQRIQDGVHVEGVDISIISDSAQFATYTNAPELLTFGQVLIAINTSTDTNHIFLMRAIVSSLQD